VFSASFTDLSVGVQTAANAPFVSVLQEIFTGEGEVRRFAFHRSKRRAKVLKYLAGTSV